MWVFFVIAGLLTMVAPLARRALARTLKLRQPEYVTPTGQRLAHFQERYGFVCSLGAGLGFIGLGLAQRFYPPLAVPSGLLVMIVSAVDIIAYVATVYSAKQR